MSARTLRRAGVAALMIVTLAAALVGWLNVRGDSHFAGEASTVAVTAQLVSRGAYLARAGNCAACHTARGGAAYAGGRGIATPFGTVYSSNLTPDCWGVRWRSRVDGADRVHVGVLFRLSCLGRASVTMPFSAWTDSR